MNSSHPGPSTKTKEPVLVHPFANSKNLLVVIPDDGVDIEEESRLYNELCEVSSLRRLRPHTFH